MMPKLSVDVTVWYAGSDEGGFSICREGCGAQPHIVLMFFYNFVAKCFSWSTTWTESLHDFVTEKPAILTFLYSHNGLVCVHV